MPDLSIIIVNYNVKEFVLNLLDSIYKAIKEIPSEIIIVDNNSSDGSVEVINKKYPNVHTIANKENLGFGKANNQAIEISNGKYILLINPDSIVKEDTFSKMIEFMERKPEIGLAGCKVLNPDGTLQLACRRSFPRPWVSFTKVSGLSSLFPKSKLFARYNLTYLDENESYEVDAVSGSFMMLRRDVLEKVKGFDPDFFMYGEDLDLCYRVQQHGYKVFYYSGTEVIHYKGESTKRSKIDETKIFYNAMHLFVKKHFSSSFLVEAILRLGIFLRTLIAFANLNKFILLGVVIDFGLFLVLVNFAEILYSSEKWLGFPEIFKPWVYIVPSVIQVLISAAFGSYKRNSLSVLRIIISLVVGFILITSLTFFFKQYAFSRAVVLITYSSAIVSFSIWRIVLKFTFLKVNLDDEIRSNTAIIGTDEEALKIAQKLRANVNSPYKVIGLIGEKLSEIGTKTRDFEIIGSSENLLKALRERKIHNLIFPSSTMNFDQIFALVAGCQGENVNFMISGNELDYMVGKSNVTHIEDFPLIKVKYNISQTIHRVIKRIFDILFSFIMLISIYPIISIFYKKKNTKFSKLMDLPKVFSGKKSFVGPLKVNNSSSLYLGKEGITGLWFIENIKENDEIENKRLDLFYAKNQNIWLDLEIIGKTFSMYLLPRSRNG